jgi:hypothetical protein
VTAPARGYAERMPEYTADAEQPEFRNVALTDALQTQDLAAVAFALRHGPTVVPLIPPGGEDPLDAGVWTYRDPSGGEITLLLFSDAAYKPLTLPSGVALNSPGWLRAFLGLYEDEIATVLFDIAGPHAMRATPTDLIAALDA